MSAPAIPVPVGAAPATIVSTACRGGVAAAAGEGRRAALGPEDGPAECRASEAEVAGLPRRRRPEKGRRSRRCCRSATRVRHHHPSLCLSGGIALLLHFFFCFFRFPLDCSFVSFHREEEFGPVKRPRREGLVVTRGQVGTVRLDDNLPNNSTDHLLPRASKRVIGTNDWCVRIFQYFFLF